MTRRFLVMLLLPLAACTPLVDGTQRVSENVNQEVVEFTDKVRELTTYHPKEAVRPPVKPTYCYRVMQDIVCYPQAQPGAAARLVAYQGPAGAGEVVTASRDAGAAQPAASPKTQQSMERFSAVKPLTVPPPPDVAEEPAP